MINYSVAYETFKRSMEQQLDFVVLVSHAVPVLSRTIAAAASGPPPVPLEPPDFFAQRRLSRPQLTQFAVGYEHELARTLVLATFSYFEAYIKAVVKEFIAFHGGAAQFLATANRRAKKTLLPLAGEAGKAKRKLQEPDNKGKTAKYSVYSSELTAHGFRFPSELFATYGLERVLQKVGKDRRLEMKANEIPSLLIDAFHMSGFAKHQSAFDDLRNLRNAIAHGQRQQVTVKAAVAEGRHLRDWAAEIDRHFTEHFFVLEQHAP